MRAEQKLRVSQVLKQEKPEDSFRKSVGGKKRQRLMLGDADLIRLRANGFRELDGEYIVNSDGTVSIAGVGRVSIRKMTATEFEQKLGDRLSALARRPVAISTEVIRYKPYYITGHVMEPGSSEWRPGLTVIQALALSGGVAREPTRDERTAPERLLQQEQARMQLKFASAQLERLYAEKRMLSRAQPSVDRTDSNGDANDTAGPSKGVLERFTLRQGEILRERIALTQSRIASLLRAKEMASSELRAAEAQKDQMAKRVELTRNLVGGLGRLLKRGIVSKSQYLERQAQLSGAIVEYANIRSLIERVKARQVQLDRQIDTIRQTRQTEINDRIEELEREVAQHRLTISDSEDTQSSTEPRQSSTSLKYHIARKHKVETTTIGATLFTELRPGDVIIVSASQREAGERVDEQAGSRLSSVRPPQSIVEQAVRSTLALGARRSGTSSRR